MKTFRAGFALLMLAVLMACSSAQVNMRRGRHNATVGSPGVQQALAALQQDLISAMGSMKSALPIYDGNRVRSIRATHAALVVVDHAMSGAKAPVRERPVVTDTVASKLAKSHYNASQIMTSQTSMRSGLSSLQDAVRQLNIAVGATPNRQGVMVSNHLTKAIAEANAAIALHGGGA